MGSSHILHAPAKVNLLLRITGKRADGFHELVTLFHPVESVFDVIRADLKSAEGISLACNAPGVPCDERNLLHKAAARFADTMGLSPSWHFDLEKKIPVAAGMGGGSSDAGTLLRFLSEQFPGCPEEELRSIACSLGADIPFFLSPCDAVARGIGEKLEARGPLPVPPMLAVFPNFPVSAAWAYRHLRAMTPRAQAEQELEELIEALRQKDFSKAASLCANDLEEPLFDKFPLLQELRKNLLEQGALCVHVSGSGPTLFALFEECSSRRRAAEVLGTPENLEAGFNIMEC